MNNYGLMNNDLVYDSPSPVKDEATGKQIPKTEVKTLLRNAVEKKMLRRDLYYGNASPKKSLAHAKSRPIIALPLHKMRKTLLEVQDENNALTSKRIQRKAKLDSRLDDLKGNVKSSRHRKSLSSLAKNTQPLSRKVQSKM